MSLKLIRKHRRREVHDLNELSDSYHLSVATLEQVISKLESYDEDNKKKDCLVLRREAENLMDPRKVKDVYLQSLLPRQDPAILSESRSYVNSQEFNKAAERVDSCWRHAANLPIKLYLTEMDIIFSQTRLGRFIGSRIAPRLKAVYGPVHAALQVGDVFIEWGGSSLVIPTKVTELVQQDINLRARLAAPVHHHGSLYGAAQEHKEAVKQAIDSDEQKIHFTQQVNHFIAVGEHRERIISKLARVIARYNSECYYDLLSRNCQHFVQECLEALEVEEPSCPEFPPNVQRQFRKIKRGQTISTRCGSKRLETHNAVDECYETNKENNLSMNDLLDLLFLYFKFHLRALKAALDKGQVEDENKWECTVGTCRMKQVEERLEELYSKDHTLRLAAESSVWMKD